MLLFIKKIFASSFLKTLILIFLLKGVVVFAVFFGFPDLGIDGLKIPHGGDSRGYYSFSRYLINGNLGGGSLPIGYPLVIIPVIKIFPNVDAVQLDFYFSLFHSLVAFTIAAGLLYKFIEIIFKKEFYAKTAAWLFVFFPYFFYFLSGFFLKSIPYAIDFQQSRTLQLLWLQSGSDYLSTAIIFGIFLAILFWNRFGNNHLFWFGLGVGLIVVMRPQNSVLLILGLILILLARKWHWFFWFLMGIIPFVGIQLLINFLTESQFFSFGYDASTNDNIASLEEHGAVIFSPWNTFKIISYLDRYEVLWLGVFILLFLSLLFLIGLYWIYNKNRIVFVLCGLILPVYIYSLTWFEPVYRNPRYFFPIIPLVFVIIFSCYNYFLEFYAKQK